MLVWGGSTSVGSNAIQLAVAAGYGVITTASPKNHAYAKALGAALVFDYRSETAIADITEAFRNRSCAGAIAIGHGSAASCLSIMRACKGRKFVAMATPPVSFNDAPVRGNRIAWLVPTMARLMSANIQLTLASRIPGVRTKFIFGSMLVDNDLSRLIYADFLPAALAEGRYVPAPNPQIVGHGLDRIEAAMQAHKCGVSAQKLVVTL